jgi:uroporphyrinogen-III synthase
MRFVPVQALHFLTAGPKGVTRVLITRPEPGATRTLNALLAKGMDAKAIPLTEIRSLAFDKPSADFDALIITSQNAIVYGASVLSNFFGTPVFVVGKRTAGTLQGHTIAAWAETAEELLAKIKSQTPKRVLYICGQTRRPELETGLKSTGISVKAVEVYSANPVGSARVKLENFFQGSKSAIVLFHAPSAAQAFLNAADTQNMPETTRFLCLSTAIAAELPAEWQNQIAIAEHPDEAAMLDQLDKMLAQDHMPKA